MMPERDRVGPLRWNALFPVRLESADAIHGFREVAFEADGAVVHIDVGGRFLVGDCADELREPVLCEPCLDVRRPPHSEHHYPVAALIEQLKKLASPWTRRVEEVRAFPSVEGIQHAVEIYADNRLLFLIHGSLHRIAA